MNRYIISYNFEKNVKNTNANINSVNSNLNNISEYNFKIGDKKTNKILKSIYKEKYIPYIKKNILKNRDLPVFNFKDHFNAFNLIKPNIITKNKENIILNFNLSNHSKIFSNVIEDKSSTNFILTELLDINKNDYAYTTLLFPTYLSNGTKKYDYLLGCLLVAYLLKNNIQNYDLFMQNKCGTKAKITCMITPDVENYIIEVLNEYFDEVIVVPYISWNDNCEGIKITDISKENIDSTHHYSKVMTKLNIFNKTLFPYKKVIFVDSDLYPMGYYDSLFSLNTPAGVLEHRRIQKMEFGVDSWGYDRGQFIKYGQKIPQYLTDLINSVASDINASLYVIQPDNIIFTEMINELQQPIDQIFNNLNHTGFWLGNKFYNFYYLPEQNYLTQKFSGQWYSIDIGFSSWMIEIENCFGFTFAGFISKPWNYQSIFHDYSINPYSLFSKINNKYSNRSYGFQLFNNYLAKMISESKYINILIEYIKDISIVESPFDTWEPELNLKKCKQNKLSSYSIETINNLSPDQKKLFLLCDKYTKIFFSYELNNILYADYIFELITKNIYNLEYIALSYKLFNILNNIAKKLNLSKKLFPFGNTLYAINKYNSFDITDDDNDFLIIIDKSKYKKKIIEMIELLLEKNLQIYFNKGNLTEFIQIIPMNVKPLYYFKENNMTCMTIHDFIVNFDILDIKFFNISIYQSQLERMTNELNINITNDMYSTYQNDNYIKLPWIDIFFMLDDKTIEHKMIKNKVTHKLFFPANENFKPTYDIFKGDKKNIKIINHKINNVKFKDFNMEYYNNIDRVNNIIIKSRHSNSNNRQVIAKVDNQIEQQIILFIINSINQEIKTIYKSFNLENYL